MGEDDIAFEVFFQVLGDRHGEKANEFINLAFAQAIKAFQKRGELHRVAPLERRRIRRGAQHETADQAAPFHQIGIKANGCIRVTL